ncbi:MAG: acyl-CoA dehydrogenase family protein [Candidatus Bathyarchaeia archaeon]
MDFELTEVQKLFQKSVRAFVEREILPITDEIDKRDEIPEELWKKMADAGFFGLRYPEKYGGTASDVVTECIFCEEMARGMLSVAFIATMQAFQCTDFINVYGTEEQKQRWLVPAIKGEKRGAFCLTEATGGTDLSRIKTTIKEDGDEVVINGSKTWVTSGPLADFYIVGAMADPDKGFWGIDFAVVDRESPGLEVGREITKPGMHGLKSSEIYFRNCRIPKENALAGVKEGKGGVYLNGILAEIRVVTAALGLGLTEAALKDSIEYAKQRVAFGRPIARFQGINFKIATVATDLEAARLITYYAAWLMDQKGRTSRECVRSAAMAKNFACELAQRATDEARRIYGALGFSDEVAVNRYYRDAGALLWGGGTTEINNYVIARELGLFEK